MIHKRNVAKWVARSIHVDPMIARVILTVSRSGLSLNIWVKGLWSHRSTFLCCVPLGKDNCVSEADLKKGLKGWLK